MFFTLFYAAATWVQSWRLSSLKSRILQISTQNGSVVLYKVPEIVSDVEGGVQVQVPSVSSHFCENVGAAKLGDLLWSVGHKRLCSVFPKQSICATRWISFTTDRSQFPISVGPDSGELELSDERLHVLLEADYQFMEDAARAMFSAEFCQLEKFGILKAWKAGTYFGLLLESDVEHLTSLGLSFMQSELTLEDGMELLRIQTVDVHGEPCPLLNADTIPVTRQQLAAESVDPGAWLMSPVQWRSHVELLQSFSSAVEEAEGSMGLVVNADRTPNLVVMEDKQQPATPPTSPLNGSVPNLETSSSVDATEEKTPPVITEAKATSGVTSHSDSFYSCASQDMAKLTESLEQLNKALESIADVEQSNGHEEDIVEIPNLPAIRKSSIGTVSHISMDSRRAPSFRSSTPSLPSSLTPRSRSPSSPIKCPNVLVFSDSSDAQENVKSLLRHTLKKYRYTVYNVNSEQLKGSAWQISTALVVVCGSVPDSLASALVTYLLAGGKMLCICSDMLHMVLPEFRTAEVRANELVTFSYQKWKKIKMLHHVFCYQQSPVHSKFGDQLSRVPTPASAVELKDREGVPHKLDVSVLGVEETWHTPSLVLAKSTGAGGKVIFSQVHLEVDPLQYESDNALYSSLKQSNSARLEIIRDILGTQLGLECSTGVKEESPSTAYFLGRHELKTEFLTSVKSRLGSSGNSLGMDNVLLQFCGKNVTPANPSSTLLPVMLHACPPHFNTVEYFDNLTTEHLGRLVVYSDVMTSSTEVLSGPPLWHGMAAVPRTQLRGKGRGNNEWLSPEGCAMFSLQLHFPLHSILGGRISLLQHIAALAIVVAIREAPGYEDIDLRLKWPNDIYAGDWCKIGGLVATSSIMGKNITCNIGCGFNLANSEPTTCLHDLLRECNSKTPPMSLEKYLAIVFSRLEGLLELAQSSEEGLKEVLQVYYAYWLHSNAEVTVLSDDGKEQQAVIQGLDEYGFLQVKDKQDGKSFSVHPDGNSFDMLQGLIRPKI